MKEFLALPARERRARLHQAAMHCGVPQQLLEHDWWQSFVLKTIFNLPLAPSVTLHGSRSLRSH